MIRTEQREDKKLLSSSCLDYLKNSISKEETDRRVSEADNAFIHQELTSHSGQNQSPSGSDVRLRHSMINPGTELTAKDLAFPVTNPAVEIISSVLRYNINRVCGEWLLHIVKRTMS